MMAMQKKQLPQPEPMEQSKSVSMVYGSAGHDADHNHHNQHHHQYHHHQMSEPSDQMTVRGWRQVKPFDYYPTPSESKPGQAETLSWSAPSSSPYMIPTRSQEHDYKSVGMPSYSAVQHTVTSSSPAPPANEATPHYQDARALMMMMMQQQHQQQQQHQYQKYQPQASSEMPSQPQMYGHSHQPLLANMMMPMSHHHQQVQPQTQMQMMSEMLHAPTSSPYKHSAKSMGNMMAAAVAAATATEQQHAMQQIQDQVATSDELPKMPGSIQPSSSSGMTAQQSAFGKTQQLVNSNGQQARIVAQLMAAVSGGNKGGSQMIKIGERPQFDPANFQLISPVEAGKQKEQQQQQQVMAALVQSAVKELSNLGTKQQSATNSSLSSVNPHSEQLEGTKDLNEIASETVKSSSLSSSSGSKKEPNSVAATTTTDDDDNSQGSHSQAATATMLRKRPQLVAARPPQQSTGPKMTSFSILGGRFKITPHTQMLQAIWEPSKQLIKHALGDLMSGPSQRPPVLPPVHQVVVGGPRRGKARGRKPQSDSKSGASKQKSSSPKKSQQPKASSVSSQIERASYQSQSGQKAVALAVVPTAASPITSASAGYNQKAQ